MNNITYQQAGELTSELQTVLDNTVKGLKEFIEKQPQLEEVNIKIVKMFINTSILSELEQKRNQIDSIEPGMADFLIEKYKEG